MATWNGGKFTRAEVVPALGNTANPQADAAAREATLKRVLGRRVRNQYLYREAIGNGLTERPELKAVLHAVEERVLADDWLMDHAAKGIGAAPAQVEDEVQRLAAQATGHEVRRFSNIFLRAPESQPEARSRARARMDDIRRELAEGAAFEDLAKKYSDSITARGGGRVEWTPRAPLHDAVAAAVFSMSEGEVGEPVETEMGLHLFRLDGIRRPSPPDLKLMREDVKRRLDGEAVEAAISAERDRAFDASGARLDAAALSRPGPKDQVVVAAAGQDLRREEFDWLREALPMPATAHPLLDFARWLVVNHVLAERRRAEPIDADLQKKLDDARFGAIVDARWRELASQIPKEVSDQEIAAFYDQSKDKLPNLRDHIVDLLFFPQTGPAPAEVYAKGEAVTAELRDGKTFDQVLERHGREPGVVVRRAVAAGDVPTLKSQSLRLARTVSKLKAGEVSPPFYMDGETVTLRGKTPVIKQKGLAFLRLIEVRAQPLPVVKDRVRYLIQHQRKLEVISAVQKRIEDQAGLKILVANP